MSAAALTQRQHWAYLAHGIQQDIAAYGRLQALLQEQFHAALRHDAASMQSIAEKISAQAIQLESASAQRMVHVQAILPAGSSVSMQAVFELLQQPLQEQFLQLWEKLQSMVAECKAVNLRNCQLIMQQAEVMQHVLTGGSAHTEIYAPS